MRVVYPFKVVNPLLSRTVACLLLVLVAGASCRSGRVASTPPAASPPSAPAAAPPFVPPGAPGDATRVITAEKATDLSQVQYTGADIKFMQGMIGHHSQAVEMTNLLKSRTASDDMRKLALRIEVSQLDALKQQDCGKRAAEISDQVRRVGCRTDTTRRVLKSVTLVPNHDAVANHRRRQARDTGLCTKGFEVRVKDRNRAKWRKDQRLLLREDNRRSKNGQEDDRRSKSTHHRMKVNFARPTTSSACQGHTKDMMRGVLWARTRT